jgi:WD40 repeat protein
VFDTRTLARTRRFPLYAKPSVIAIDPNGRTLAMGTATGAVGFADVRAARALGRPQHAHIGAVRNMAFSPDGRRLATTDGADVYLWDVRHQRLVRIFIEVVGSATSLSFSPDGNVLLVTATQRGGRGLVNILGMPRLQLLRRIVMPTAEQVLFSQDRDVLLYRDNAGHVGRLDTRAWTPVGAPLSGQQYLGSFAVDPRGGLLATTSTRGVVRLWDIGSGRPLGAALPGVPGRPAQAAFVAGGSALVTLYDDGRGFVWDVRPQSWARRACAVAGRTLTRAEWRQAFPNRRYAPACA